MSKSSQAFRTIREVSDWLDVKAHVLRFWESKFPQIRPVKRAGGRRYYRPGDMELVGGIKVLLHEQGMTIKGVQDLIRDEGTSHVASLSPPIDMLDFEDAPSDEIEAWDRELAAEAVEDAVIMGEVAGPQGATAPADAAAAEEADDAPAAEEVTPPPTLETAAPETVDTGPPSDADAADGVDDAASFDLETELAELEATLAADGAPETGGDDSPELPFDDAETETDAPIELIEEAADATETTAADTLVLDASFSAPEAEEAAVESPLEPAEIAASAAEPEASPPAPEAAGAVASESDAAAETGPAPEPVPVPAPEPVPEPAPAADALPEEIGMARLMSDFAEVTARIPMLAEGDRAQLQALLARSADLAARMSP